jgi:predicted MPP superfamily phosphohydrolase
MPEAHRLFSIKPVFGKYAIMGNHEYYAGIKRSLEFTNNAGFDVLRDEVRQVAGISIFGADDITATRLDLRKNKNTFDELLASGNNKGFVLLMRHQPFVSEKEKFNLQLSGHTHGGQLFPFQFITRLFFKRNYGYYELGKNKYTFDELLASGNNKGFVLLLRHQPFVSEKEKFNLQLSGHTHGGQIFPFQFITRLFFKRNYGYYELGQNKSLYVSGGTGTWGPPVRTFAHPEITIIDIIGKKAN